MTPAKALVLLTALLQLLQVRSRMQSFLPKSNCLHMPALKKCDGTQGTRLCLTVSTPHSEMLYHRDF